MNKRWMLSYDLGTTYIDQCTPTNEGSVKFERTQNLGEGQIFFRRKLTTTLSFKDVFPLWWLRRRSALSCTPIFIRREYFCGGIWKVVWTGRFAVAEADFDLARCQVSVLPRVYDQYSCILDEQDNRVNVLGVEPVVATGQVAINIEWGLYMNVDLFGCVYQSAQPSDILGGEWALAHTHTLNPSIFASYEWQIYWREVTTSECIGGVGIPPAGTGWSVLYDNCSLNGTVTWWREPINPYTYGDSFFGDAACPAGFIKTLVFEGGTVVPIAACDGGPREFAARYICVPDEQIEFPRARPLHEVVQYVVDKADCGELTVRSDFFEWDPIGDAPGFFPGINYVTGTTNKVDHIVILQKSDAVTPGATNPAAIGEWTFKDLMKALNTMFQVFWDIDDEGNLRIEHWKYWTLKDTYDITIVPSLNEPMKFASVSSTVPKIERLTFAEAGLKDFIGADIVYEGPCTSDDLIEYSPGSVTTDISFVITDPNSIDNRGFVMLATDFIVDTYVTIIENGALSLAPVTNAPLSTANLQRDYWTWNRYLPSGTMNTRPATFDGVLPNIEQQDVTMQLCCENLLFDPRDAIRSNLGVDKLGGRLGSTTKVDETELSNTITLTIRYFL